MRLFLATEAQTPAAALISSIIRKINVATGDIEVTEYTNALDRVGIIVNCFDATWMSWGYGKERKYISYKKHYADIRLNIPLECFMDSSSQTRFDLVKGVILESIRIIDSKVNTKKGCIFEGEKMIKLIEDKISKLN